MKKYIEALKQLFGDEVIVQEFSHEVFHIDDGDTYWSNSDQPYICHLIDEALLKREDVVQYEWTAWDHSDTSERDDAVGTCFEITQWNGKQYVLHTAPGDPLTARLEALVKLMENQ